MLSEQACGDGLQLLTRSMVPRLRGDDGFQSWGFTPS
jgi:hypothetical protein